jgi:hypothetical protein
MTVSTFRTGVTTFPLIYQLLFLGLDDDDDNDDDTPA